MANTPQKKDETTTRTAKTAAARAKQTAAKSTASGSEAAKSTASSGAEAAKSATSGAVPQAALTKVGSALGSVQAKAGPVVSQATTLATTAWTVVRARKLIATAGAVGTATVAATAFAAGRRSQRAAHGPLTRLTGGRI
ncbi:hypothetical protein H9Y04_19245 [Streptomyces sp. TRM66268-LWL]|uniref:Uncharacterized protein n=1 Tax=Streptomyces polyasparticus TaxID=2767826 RepID=A0ABR7SGT5_9ACTN|nr:hypothetical protein [Streptomyces polyasparticus]MBC9714697.1 hypothetical protein [Streptomyces polyasparticus]